MYPIVSTFLSLLPTTAAEPGCLDYVITPFNYYRNPVLMIH